ncbi:hemin uptake protein HemP [Eilatimonas milleporae]|uniref:Hemin uptake protein hemP n=1 Tax=Eilatimonas milleporae TaxID=911205 RepID=A0A3M0CFW1_9PROT|nr:hemin uptake protein HemP [Eilatimonas milleporae]RMB07707.1 hemin uptake protein hemP [Eilatimonas milleporae]
MTTQTLSPSGGTRHAVTPMRRLTSSDLLKGNREIIIEHAGGEYRLRLTSQGKLILTK